MIEWPLYPRHTWHLSYSFEVHLPDVPVDPNCEIIAIR